MPTLMTKQLEMVDGFFTTFKKINDLFDNPQQIIYVVETF